MNGTVTDELESI